MPTISSKNTHIENLFEQVLVLIQQETSLLDKDDIDALEELTARREKIMAEIWESRAECGDLNLLKHWEQLQQAQEELFTKAQAQHNDIRQQLLTRKKQSGYFANAQKQAAFSDKAFYMNKIS